MTPVRFKSLENTYGRCGKLKVKAITDYFDLQLHRPVQAGEELDVSAARAKELSSTDNRARTKLAEIIEESTPTTDKVAKKPAPKKKAEVK